MTGVGDVAEVLKTCANSVVRGNSGRISRSSDEVFNDVQQTLADKEASSARRSATRKFVYKIIKSPAFDLSMSCLVLLNMVFVVLEVNVSAKQDTSPAWLSAANFLVLFVYFVEIILKLFALRSEFFCDLFSMLDLFVITIDVVVTIIILIMPVSLAPLVLARVARILKVTRALRMLVIFPEMNVLVQGIFFASRTIFWGVMLLVALLCFWSIFATLFIHPIVMELEQEGYWAKLDCERCARSFASVELSMLTFTQQLIVGEGWSEVNTPLIEKRPETAIFFVLVMVSLTLAALNLLMGIIVERASEASAATAREVASKKEQEREAASSKLFALCGELDEDNSGCLTLDELKKGYQQSEEFADLMRVMDIEERDLDVVYAMLDTDGSGDVGYKEFVEQLYLLKTQEQQTLLVFIKFYVMEIRARLNHVTVANKPQASRPTPRQAVGPDGLQEPVFLDSREPEDDMKKLSELTKDVLDFWSSHWERLNRLQVHIAGMARKPLAAVTQKQPDADGCFGLGSTCPSTQGSAPYAVPPGGNHEPEPVHTI